MPRRTEHLPLTGSSPGTTRSVMLHRYGAPGARPKAYLQASLHADETPALLTAHHLLRLLDEADARGAIQGEIAVAPYANPIGLDQHVNDTHLGRHELGGAGNFNRNWPDLYPTVVEKVDGKLTASAEENVALIRAAMIEAIDAWELEGEIGSLRQTLARQAADADIVLDLHCDDEALMYLYLTPAHWPAGQSLAAELGCRAVMLTEDSGGNAFDEAFSTPWIRLARRFPEHPIPPACLSGTVELRGQADVADEIAEADAGSLFRNLQREGLIAGDPGPLPKPLCEATQLDACDIIRAPAAGVLSYTADLGAPVRAGDLIAWLIDPAATDMATARQAIHSRANGLLLSRRLFKYVQPGMTVAKVVGTAPLAHRQNGSLNED